MADRTKTTNELKLVAAFSDGDDRTLSLTHPKGGLTEAQVNATLDKAKKALVGDKAYAPMTKWKSAKIVESSVTYLDITPTA